MPTDVLARPDVASVQRVWVYGSTVRACVSVLAITRHGRYVGRQATYVVSQPNSIENQTQNGPSPETKSLTTQPNRRRRPGGGPPLSPQNHRPGKRKRPRTGTYLYPPGVLRGCRNPTESTNLGAMSKPTRGSGWNGHDRRARLPGDWKARRAKVLSRDKYLCQIADDKVCTGVATEVDHINAGDDHSYRNLQAVCQACHFEKTLAERVNRKPAKEPRRHPGLR